MDRTDTPFTCQDVSERLIDYHYDELPATERGRVARHLARCGDCARAYCALHADLTALGWSDDTARPGTDLHQRLRGAVERRFRRSLWQRLSLAVRRPIPVYQALAFAVLVLLALWFALPARPLSSTNAALQPSDRQVLIENYDAADLMALSPNTL
ncbi:MAG: zf-HC2 domain-containing protein [Deltaproteobacteria bacterium]|nr:zf-HC2 domain-containing protein [Deltaproteobacteria bacterium]